MEALVLIACDDHDVTRCLGQALARQGLRVAVSGDGPQTWARMGTSKPDLLMLDVHLPRPDGWQVLAALRRHGDTGEMPVIMLGASDREDEQLMALRIGADDYLARPLNVAVAVAKIQAILRRLQARQERHAHGLLRAGPLQIDLDRHEAVVEIGGRRHVLGLTLTEFRLLAHLMRAPQRVASRSELLAACLPERDSLERAVDSHLSKLRKKLEAAGVRGTPCCVRGIGYKLR